MLRLEKQWVFDALDDSHTPKYRVRCGLCVAVQGEPHNKNTEALSRVLYATYEAPRHMEYATN